MDAEDFLELLWGEREGWVELPAKVNQYWVPCPLEWPPDDDLYVSRRIDRCLFDREDLYYSVAMFRERGRNYEDVLPHNWLWADLDEVHPSEATGMGFMPTIAVQSSPGRYQALWQLTKLWGPKTIEKLNRALTYTLGADRGGWDLTQVLRLPGTRNFKYSGGPPVRMMWYEDDLVYDAREVWSSLKKNVSEAELVGAVEQVLPKKPIPRKAQQLLLASEAVPGERSDRLWELNCMLAEAGLTEDEIYTLVVGTVWNKFADNRRGMEARLRRDVMKALRHVREKAYDRRMAARREMQAVKADDGGGAEVEAQAEEREESVVAWVNERRLPAVPVGKLVSMKIEEPKWLVEDIWTWGSHGIIGGEPKTGKSTLALALGLAVASGQPFLGKFEVGDQGPVLMVQEENTEALLQDWTRKFMHFTDIMETDIPMRIVTKAGFDLAVEEHREILETDIAKTKPKLVILDPLAMMFGQADLDKSYAIAPYLRWIIQVGHTYNCAIALVHHTGKRTQNTVGRRAGQRLLGSTALHGFVNSALYTSRIDAHRDNWMGVQVEREFRETEPMPALNLSWHFDSRGSSGMQLEMTAQTREDLILEMVRDGRKTLNQLVEESGYGKRAIMRYADRNPELKRTHGRGSTIWVEHISSNGASSNSKRR